MPCKDGMYRRCEVRKCYICRPHYSSLHQDFGRLKAWSQVGDLNGNLNTTFGPQWRLFFGHNERFSSQMEAIEAVNWVRQNKSFYSTLETP